MKNNDLDCLIEGMTRLCHMLETSEVESLPFDPVAALGFLCGLQSEFQFKELDLLIRCGALTVNELREKLDWEPTSESWGNEPVGITKELNEVGDITLKTENCEVKEWNGCVCLGGDSCGGFICGTTNFEMIKCEKCGDEYKSTKVGDLCSCYGKLVKYDDCINKDLSWLNENVGCSYKACQELDTSSSLEPKKENPFSTGLKRDW